MSHGLRLRSFKIIFDPSGRGGRIRVVPSLDIDGRPFAGPGIDVLGVEAAPLFEKLGPLRAWFSARDEGASLRSLLFDFTQGRALATLRPSHDGRAVQALRLDEPTAPDLFDHARTLGAEIAFVAERVLARRASRVSQPGSG